jgi:hypothetical protein
MYGFRRARLKEVAHRDRLSPSWDDHGLAVMAERRVPGADAKKKEARPLTLAGRMAELQPHDGPLSATNRTLTGMQNLARLRARLEGFLVS